ncbi:MAG: hypothetical protein CMJ18_15695 [Phycisphaeraceae bacterium]|nr:hypothetical protein [Phycisphaeraceae bacterium]
MYCDLHTHSTASDGTTAPSDLAALAATCSLGAIALTDHDTTDGLDLCAEACRTAHVRFVPGIEISADPGPPPGADPDSPVRRGTLHILGLFVRGDDPHLGAVQQRMRAARDCRNPAIIDKLVELGVTIEYEEVLELARIEGTAILGRPHIAQVLVRKGYVKSVQDAFHRYLGQGAAAYVRRDRLPAAEAIEAVHHAGGLAVLAHPVQLGCRDEQQLTHAVRRLTDLGLDGVETRHSDHTRADTLRFEDLASRFDLLTSGGSDFHGSRKPVELGSQKVPFEVYERLAEEATRRR